MFLRFIYFFELWSVIVKGFFKNQVWVIFFYVIAWFLWEERNKIVFEKKNV